MFRICSQIDHPQIILRQLREIMVFFEMLTKCGQNQLSCTVEKKQKSSEIFLRYENYRFLVFFFKQ